MHANASPTTNRLSKLIKLLVANIAIAIERLWMRNGSQLFEKVRHVLERFNCSKLNVIVIHLHVRARNTEGLVL